MAADHARSNVQWQYRFVFRLSLSLVAQSRFQYLIWAIVSVVKSHEKALLRLSSLDRPRARRRSLRTTLSSQNSKSILILGGAGCAYGPSDFTVASSGWERSKKIEGKGRVSESRSSFLETRRRRRRRRRSERFVRVRLSLAIRAGRERGVPAVQGDAGEPDAETQRCSHVAHGPPLPASCLEILY